MLTLQITSLLNEKYLGQFCSFTRYALIKKFMAL
ncbi:unnamed protein product [Paramecium pentaurelia]|uniref:Uncharacterized protein n=1 Tax=Paramecium pentaurelia TaxID=43138 RepID=A0A8S1TQM5_9CILI|nr:unnamed protein product [Paramecium pentaurelia]